jgi:hypothetical protein
LTFDICADKVTEKFFIIIEKTFQPQKNTAIDRRYFFVNAKVDISTFSFAFKVAIAGCACSTEILNPPSSDVMLYPVLPPASDLASHVSY